MKEPLQAPEIQVLQRLLRDDTSAWGELVREYSGFLLAAARRTFSGYGASYSDQDCEDAVADVWRNLLENNRKLIHDCIARGNFLQMIQVLVRHRSVDILRRRQKAVTELTDSIATPAPEEPTNDFGIEPEALTAALKTLTPREGTLIQLFFLQRKKYHQIAAMTGIPQNSIGPTLARALAKLKKELGEP